MILNPGTVVSHIGNDLAGEKEQCLVVVPSADDAVQEAFTVTFPAFASIAQADYFIFENGDADIWAVWMDKDADGTAPTGGEYVASNVQVKVSISTGNTAAQVAAAAQSAIEGTSGYTGVTISTPSTGVRLFSYTAYDNFDDVVTLNADDSGAGSLVAEVTQQGQASSLNEKYFALVDGAGTHFYVWNNFDSTGSDPSGTGTGVEVAQVSASSASVMAAAIQAAVDAETTFEAKVDGNKVYIINTAVGDQTDAADVNTGFTISTTIQGRDDLFSAADSPILLSNNPTAF